MGRVVAGGDSRTRTEIEADAQYRRLREASGRLDASLAGAIREGKRMSLLGKMAALTERASDFNTSTESVLDGISAKIEAAVKKRDEAAAKHHGYYDTIIKGVDESVAVIDRLSNVPLGEGGGN